MKCSPTSECCDCSICRCSVQVSGLGTFQVRITTLRRDDRTTTGTSTSTHLSNNGTVPVCRTFVRYCLTNYLSQQPSVPFTGRCEYAELTSPVITGCSLPHLHNFTGIMPFTFTWTVCNISYHLYCTHILANNQSE